MSRAAVGLIVLVGLAGCSAPTRSVSYFTDHLDDAKAVAADCRTGSHRGPECDNAQAGIAAAARDARLREFQKAF